MALGVGVVLTLAGAALGVGWWSGQSKPHAKAEQDKLVAPVFSSASDVAATPVSTIGITPSVLYSTSFVGADGKNVSLGQWQKKLLVINFWATWCAPCLEEMPIFARLQTKLGEKGVQIVGIAADSQANVVKFEKKLVVNYPLLPDEAGAIELSKRLGNRLGLLPHTIVVAPGGEVVFAKLGVVGEADFEAILLKNLPK